MATALGSTPVSASAPVDIAQCNGADGGGSVISCDVTITNTLDGNVTSSQVTVARHCAGTNVVCGETAGTTTNYPTQLVTSVHQCNNAGNGGGSTMTCTVRVTNNITGATTVTPATVNQCNGSGDGLGAPKVSCNPFPATTTGADVTECNGSANGGTLVGLNCTVTSGTTAAATLPIAVNECNGSDNGGGSKVMCSTAITNNVTASVVSPGPTTTPTTASPGGGPGGPTTGNGQPPVPNVPHTGGAAGQPEASALVIAGLGSLLAVWVARARRRHQPAV
ncbi:MAG: hypothetical protein JF887_07045 [Candidatus Dormibacteraeota bacterium]|uniref:Uncharacterized protein n=1 Tax=Candidatus Amunia macphersoniae TaxID=3127014 RepID=A0A934NJB8_9BACT|nr:hypothetical protein [Candidatus Dormibacteraeota bacterium]